jgi:hypothetical protein
MSAFSYSKYSLLLYRNIVLLCRPSVPIQGSDHVVSSVNVDLPWNCTDSLVGAFSTSDTLSRCDFMILQKIIKMSFTSLSNHKLKSPGCGPDSLFYVLETLGKYQGRVYWIPLLKLSDIGQGSQTPASVMPALYSKLLF